VGSVKRNIFLILLVLVLFSLFIVGCVPFEEVESQKPIKIALNVWPGYAHAFIAQEKGFFEKNGVNVELILKEDYSESQDLYLYGDVDGVFEVYSDTIFHNAEGIISKVVYVADYSDTGDVIIGKPEFNSLADLNGKKVGIEGINTFSHLFVLSALEGAGILEGNFELENVAANDVLTALDNNQIDAGHTWEPTTSAAVEKGYKILGKAGDVPGVITDVLVFNKKTIEERPEAVQAIVKSMFEARDFVYSNREEALDIMSVAEDMAREEMNEGIEGVILPNLQENVDEMKDTEEVTSLYTSGRRISDFYSSRGQLTTEPNFDEIIEPKFVNNLE